MFFALKVQIPTPTTATITTTATRNIRSTTGISATVVRHVTKHYTATVPSPPKAATPTHPTPTQPTPTQPNTNNKLSVNGQ